MKRRLPLVFVAALGPCLLPVWSQAPTTSALEDLAAKKFMSSVPLGETDQRRQLRILGRQGVVDPALSALLERLRIRKERKDAPDAADKWLQTLIPKLQAALPASTPKGSPGRGDRDKVILPGSPRLPPPMGPPWTKGLPGASSPFGTNGLAGIGALQGPSLRPIDISVLSLGDLWDGRRPEGFNPLGFLEIVSLLNQKLGKACTGTLVTPDKVLTAAHCIRNSANEDIRVVTHHRDEPQERKCAAAMAERRYIRCTRISIGPPPVRTEIHPSYMKGAIEYDLALVTLGGDLPQARPARIDFDASFAAVTLAGFGVTDAKDDVRSPDFADSLQRLEVGWHGGNIVRNATTLAWAVEPSKFSSSGACHKDSGGPVYAGHRAGYEGDGDHVLVAVIRGARDAAACTRYVTEHTRLSNPKVRQWLCGALDRKQMRGCPTTVPR